MRSRANEELRGRESARRKIRAKAREAKSERTRTDREEEETNKRQRQANQRTQGPDYQARMRTRTQARLDNNESRSKSRVTEAESSLSNTRTDKEINDGYKNGNYKVKDVVRLSDNADVREKRLGDDKIKAEVARIRAKKYRDKGKKLFERHGKGSDLENQRELRTTATRIAGNAKDGVKLLERRLKGGDDFTDEDNAKFNEMYAGQLRKSGRTDEEIADIGNRMPKLKRVENAERIAKLENVRKQIDPVEVESFSTQLLEGGEKQGRAMMGENMNVLTTALSDGKLEDKELKDFNKGGDWKLTDPKYDADIGVWTGTLTNSKTKESKPLNMNQAQIQGMTNAFKHINDIDEKAKIKKTATNATIALKDRTIKAAKAIADKKATIATAKLSNAISKAEAAKKLKDLTKLETESKALQTKLKAADSAYDALDVKILKEEGQDSPNKALIDKYKQQRNKKFKERNALAKSSEKLFNKINKGKTVDKAVQTKANQMSETTDIRTPVEAKVKAEIAPKVTKGVEAKAKTNPKVTEEVAGLYDGYRNGSVNLDDISLPQLIAMQEYEKSQQANK